jgi:hypothetical protein
MTAEEGWLVANLAGTAIMVGFIWTIQLLNYPMMAAVPADDFPAYEAVHTRRVSVLLAIIAPLEVVAAAGVALFVPDVPRWLSVGAGAVLVAIWVSTGVYYAPIHGRLSSGFDPELLRRLVTTNWLRTGAWTVRGVAAVAMIAVAL